MHDDNCSLKDDKTAHPVAQGSPHMDITVKDRSILRSIGTPFHPIPPALSVSIGVLVWIAVVGLWFLVTRSGLAQPMFLPEPGAVLGAVVEAAADGSLWEHTSASLQVVLIGFALSSIIAIPLGLTMGTYRIVQAVLDPLVNFIRYLPVTSFVPLFILWIGIGIEQRVAVIIFGIFFQQLVLIADAARSVPRDLVNTAYTLGTSRIETVAHIIFPASLPSIFDVLRVTMGWAWTFLVVAELVAARSGLGYISLKAMRGFQVDVIFMAIAMIGLLGLVTDQIFRVLRKVAAPWAR
ncbi:ABC transporter permease [Consotaella aegiceratis]|uniref:ABC transporter permease n=1 Tax=Consotaella aegiceratis TaxID=3097961 RepID=UPI002F3F1F7F